MGHLIRDLRNYSEICLHAGLDPQGLDSAPRMVAFEVFG